MRTGFSPVRSKMSMISPRMANCPGPPTCGVFLWYPIEISFWERSMVSMVSPFLIVRMLFFRSFKGTCGVIRAARVVTMQTGFASMSFRRQRMRSDSTCPDRRSAW